LPDQDNSTPEEILAATYAITRHAVSDGLLEQVRKTSPRFFELLVVELLVAMGYGGSREDAEAVGRSGDGGIDVS